MFSLSGNICLVWLVAHSGSLVLTEIIRRRSKVFRLHVTENKWSKGKNLPSVKTRLLFSNFHFCCSDCFPLKSFRSCLNPNKCIFIGVRWLLIVALHWFYHNGVQEVAVPEVLYEEVIEVDERVVLKQGSCQLPRKDAKRIVTGGRISSLLLHRR